MGFLIKPIDMSEGAKNKMRQQALKITKEKILAMKAGRELDKVVAEQIFGLIISGTHLGLILDEEGRVAGNTPDYSTNISAAWSAVEKFTNEKYNFALVWCVNHWGITIDKADKDGHSVKCLASVPLTNEAPEAICKAALLAKLAI